MTQRPRAKTGKKDDDVPHLTLGSKFRVLSLGSRDQTLETKGIFRGITTVGSIDAVALEDEQGKLRVIPSHMLLAVDILEAAESEEDVDLGDVHYG